MSNDFTLGVEEEYQIVDARTRGLCPREQQVLAGAEAVLGERVQPEFHASQIEIATPVCRTLEEVRAQLVQARKALREAAVRDGNQIAAAGTHPFSQSQEQPITPKTRYQDMAHDYGPLAEELVIFGCHIHVGVADPEDAVRVLSRARAWLSPLLALSANSPFWEGADTGYASFRTELWVRWPMAGPPPAFASRAEYDQLLQDLTDTGSISDPTKIYWDIRVPAKTPTLEFRVADVCLTVDEAVLLTGLTRALAQTCLRQAQADAPFVPVRAELLRAAHWRAARHGLEDTLIDLQGLHAAPASEVVHSLLAFTRYALEETKDWDWVSAQIEEVLARGNGAQRQRAVFEKTGRWEDVVDFIVTETERGTL